MGGTPPGYKNNPISKVRSAEKGDTEQVRSHLKGKNTVGDLKKNPKQNQKNLKVSLFRN